MVKKKEEFFDEASAVREMKKSEKKKKKASMVFYVLLSIAISFRVVYYFWSAEIYDGVAWLNNVDLLFTGLLVLSLPYYFARNAEYARMKDIVDIFKVMKMVIAEDKKTSAQEEISKSVG